MATAWAPDEHLIPVTELVIVRSVVPLLSLALVQREQRVQLTDAATRDALTGLHNRRQLLSQLAELTAAGRTATVLFCDLDGFKPINDRYGHLAGDQVLAAVGARLATATRGADCTARAGGDEFAVAVSDICEPDAARALADRLLAAVTAPITVDVDGRAVPLAVGASIGVAVPADGCTADPDAMLAAADRAMYEAKRAGTNRHHLVVVEG